ncbi:LysR family transcriptional regulator [uncultured Propionivibrio sp.]|uniref:LysR family transcriptional regulator n=1 Tax=uncultured Propionivibrio sp. TaxID=426737 RepID=UPI0029C00538|nr:LysR family transcriptional regulator [uncultured Propionivibrio sp.]
MTHSGFTPQLLNRLRMRQIVLMLAIHEHRTLHHAAEHIGLSQPAASKMLHELEQTLGEPLFDRVGRGMQLNAAGQAVMNTFRAISSNMTALSRELNELRLGSAGKLIVGSIMVAAPDLLADALIRLKQRFPLLSVEVIVDTSDRLLDLLRNGKLDVMIGRMPDIASVESHDCVFHAIGEEAISVVASRDHPLQYQAREGAISFSALLAYTWILQPRGSPSREMIEQEARSHHLPLPQGLIETTSILLAESLIAHSDMIAVIPHSIARHYEAHSLLRIIPYEFTHTLTPWGSLVHRDRTVSPIAEEFLYFLKNREPSP